MRSWTVLQPGEFQGCIGCHESKLEAPPVVPSGQLVVRKLKPMPGQPPHPLLDRLAKAGRLGTVRGFMGVYATCSTNPAAASDGFSFSRVVQPILNRSCVRCHDGAVKDRPNLSECEVADRKMVFEKPGWRTNVDGHRRLTCSYLALTQNGRQTKRVNWYSSTGVSEMLPPCAQGSMRSGLMDFFAGRHHGVVVSDEDFRAVACWIDLGVPFVGSYCEATDWTEDDREIFLYHQCKREAFAEVERAWQHEAVGVAEEP